MGYIRHNAIVLTSWAEPKIKEAHQYANESGLITTNLSEITTIR